LDSQRKGLTFIDAFEKYAEKKLPELRTDRYRSQLRATVKKYAFPELGDMLVQDISRDDSVGGGPGGLNNANLFQYLDENGNPVTSQATALYSGFTTIEETTVYNGNIAKDVSLRSDGAVNVLDHTMYGRLGALLRAWGEQRQLLQMTREVWRYECVFDRRD
jgi:hypothetical protein